MNRTEIKTQLAKAWDESPVAVIATGAAVVTATAKLIDALSAAQGRNAYAKQVKLAEKRHRK